MPSSGMWRRVSLVRSDVWEEPVATIFRVEIMHDLGTAI
jgi:hypothetical protein